MLDFLKDNFDLDLEKDITPLKEYVVSCKYYLSEQLREEAKAAEDDNDLYDIINQERPYKDVVADFIEDVYGESIRELEAF